MTTLLFRTTRSTPKGGEADVLAVVESPNLTPEQVLDHAREVLTSQSFCRIGVLEVVNGVALPRPGWRAERYKAQKDVPQGAYAVHLPGKARDIEDDMDIEITLDPWVGVYQERWT
jgi:hypothetical protein